MTAGFSGPGEQSLDPVGGFGASIGLKMQFGNAPEGSVFVPHVVQSFSLLETSQNGPAARDLSAQYATKPRTNTRT